MSGVMSLSGRALRKSLRVGSRILRKIQPNAGNETSQGYWSHFHVDAPDAGYPSVSASLDHFDWRNRQYPGYIELMPVDRADGLVVMDYGCGPGNDVIGFGHFSRPKKIHAVDVSSNSLALASKRAELHNLQVDFVKIAESPVALPLEDGSVDLVHTSGVLHHTPDPGAILREFKRVLRPTGYGQIMVYHHDSIWMHLFVAHHKIIVEGMFGGLTKRQAFEKTLDGEDCPIACCYTAAEFISLAGQQGLRCEFTGASMSLHELTILPRRFEALVDKRLDRESRDFLHGLTFNDRGWPVHQGTVAGINGCYRIFPH